MRIRPWRGVAVGWFVAAALGAAPVLAQTAAPAAAPATAPASRRAADSRAAAAYLDRVLAGLDAIEADLPAVTAAAEAAAKPFLEGKPLGLRGDSGLAEEMASRSGGFAQAFPSGPGQPGDLVLYAFGLTTKASPEVRALLDKQLADAAEVKAKGSVVIGFASADELRKLGLLGRAKDACTSLLDTHAATVASPPLNSAAAWAWTAELFGACTRAGKTPTMLRSAMLGPEEERNARYRKSRFHDDLKVEPMPAGRLGREYLTATRGILREVREKSLPAVAEAAQRLADTPAAGGKVYGLSIEHCTPYHIGGKLADDPLHLIEMTDQAVPGPSDSVVVLGYAFGPSSPFWSKKIDAIRGAGRGVIWVISSFGVKPGELRAGELLVDQRWPAGDAAVAPPGYDVKVFPASGVISEALLWAMSEQSEADRGAHTGAQTRTAAGER